MSKKRPTDAELEKEYGPWFRNPAVNFELGPPRRDEAEIEPEEGFEERALAFAEKQNAHFERVLRNIFQATP